MKMHSAFVKRETCIESPAIADSLWHAWPHFTKEMYSGFLTLPVHRNLTKSWTTWRYSPDRNLLDCLQAGYLAKTTEQEAIISV